MFEQAGIPKDLVYMAHVESAFKTNAYSRAKAKGIYQFIAATGRRYGLRIDSWVDERSDPEKSARAAAAYLKDLYGMFGDWYLALAAYNAGEGKIQRSLAKTRKDDFWSLASTRSLRAETRHYVPAILAATLIAKQPEKFGFDVRLDEPFVSDVVKIDGQTDLRVLARLADLDPETLRQLNPQLRRGMTPPGTTTDVRVPVGHRRRDGAGLRGASGGRPIGPRAAPGRGGRIARVRRTALQRQRRRDLHGQRSRKERDVAAGAGVDHPCGRAARRTISTSRGRHGGLPGAQGGHALADRERATGRRPSRIASASGISLHSSLRVGQRLIIPAKGGSTRAAAPAARADRATATSAVVHTVRRGETLYRIADQYQVTVNQICALNSINPDGVIYPGTRLKIRAH